MAIFIPLRKSRPDKLPCNLRERIVDYFMRRYPCTKKIKVGSNSKRAYNVRVNYRWEDVNRTFVVSAYTYESLILYVNRAYVERGVIIA